MITDDDTLVEGRDRLRAEAREHVREAKAKLAEAGKLQDEMDAYAVDNQIYAGMTLKVSVHHHGERVIAETVGATGVPEGMDWPRHHAVDYSVPQALTLLRDDLWRWLDAGAEIVVVPYRRKKKGKK